MGEGVGLVSYSDIEQKALKAPSGHVDSHMVQDQIGPCTVSIV